MTNYFQLLNIPESFALNLTTLEQNYFTAQRKYHPDRFVGKPDSERLAAAQHSADINTAYKTLKAPLSRAQYLLKLQGVVVGTEKDTVRPSQDLLTEVMEWRENEIPVEKLQKIREESVAAIGKHYTNNAWDAMAQETLRLGYIVKTLNEI
jgi:molecular chaperone HscB